MLAQIAKRVAKLGSVEAVAAAHKGNSLRERYVRALAEEKFAPEQKPTPEVAPQAAQSEKAVQGVEGEQKPSTEAATAQGEGAATSTYFEKTGTSLQAPLGDFIPRGTPDAARLKSAHALMDAAAAGQGKKRPPLTAVRRSDGKLKLIDGNTTYQALKDRGETHAEVEVVPPYQHGVETIDDLFKQAKESAPDMDALAAELAEKYGATVKPRNKAVNEGMKSRASAERKIGIKYEGHAARTRDILGITLIFDNEADARRAYNDFKKDDRMVDEDDKYSKHSVDGYRDFSFEVMLPSGHIGEVKFNTRKMIAAESGLGHKIYELTRAMKKEIKAGVFGKDTDTVEKARQELLAASSRFFDSIRSSAIEDLTRSSHSSREISTDLHSILWAVSPVISRHPDSSIVSGAKTLNDFLSSTKGSPSFLRYLKSDILTPPDSQNIKQNQPKVKPGVVRGEQVTLKTTDGDMAVMYEIREASYLIPSHDPTKSFQKNPAYPDQVQERAYHRDTGEQQKVIGNARKYDAGWVINNNPDATNGPPIITNDGVVLGGNSRVMTQQLAYAQKDSAAMQKYREMLIERAEEFGIDPAAVDNFKEPVLVRTMVEQVGSREDMSRLARVLNQTKTQVLGDSEIGVSKARLVSASSMNTLAEGITAHGSLKEYLGKNNSRAFIESLISDGVIEQAQLSSLRNKDGLLNDNGKSLVEKVLLGKAINDADSLNNIEPYVRQKILSALPDLSVLAAQKDGWNLNADLEAASNAIHGYKSAGYPSLKVYLEQATLPGVDIGTDLNPRARELAYALDALGPKDFATKVKKLALFAKKDRAARTQHSMIPSMPTAKTPARAFTEAFGAKAGTEPATSQGEGIRRFKDGDTVGRINKDTAGETNRLGFKTAESDVTISRQDIDHIDKSHGGQLTEQDIDYLKKTVEEPTEVLPNLSTDRSPGRSGSVLLVRQNGKDYVSIVEMTPGEVDNRLVNYWKMSRKSADQYLEKFRQEKTRRIQSGETTNLSYSSLPPEGGVGKAEGLSGRQTETTGKENISTPSEKGNTPSREAGTDTKYSKGEDGTSPKPGRVSSADAQSVLDALSKKLGIEFDVRQSPAELGAHPDAVGMYLDGKRIIFADNLTTKEQALAEGWHELTHDGIAAMRQDVSDKFGGDVRRASNIVTDTLIQIYATSTEEIRELSNQPDRKPNAGEGAQPSKNKLITYFNTVNDSSKVLDANGEPLVVFHSTEKAFNKFDSSKTQDAMFWFTSDKGAIERGEVGAAGRRRGLRAFGIACQVVQLAPPECPPVRPTWP